MSCCASPARAASFALLLLSLAAVTGCRGSSNTGPPFAGLDLQQGSEPATSRVFVELGQMAALAPEEDWNCQSLVGYLLPVNQRNRSYISVAKRYGVWPLSQSGRIACQDQLRRLVSPSIPAGPYYLVVLRGERCPKFTDKDPYIEGQAYLAEIQVPENEEFEAKPDAISRTFDLECGW